MNLTQLAPVGIPFVNGSEVIIKGASTILKRVKCTASPQTIYTVPAGYIFVGSGNIVNPTAGAITNMQWRATYNGSTYLLGAVVGSVASKAISIAGGGNLILYWDEGTVFQVTASANGLVAGLRGILIPKASNPNVMLKTITASSAAAQTIYAAPAGKQGIILQSNYNISFIPVFDSLFTNLKSGGGAATLTLSLRPTADAYVATDHDLSVNACVDSSTNAISPLASLIPESHTLEIRSSAATAGQIVRTLIIEIDA